MSNLSGNPRIAALRARRRPAVAFATGVLACALLFLIGAQAWNAWSARELRLAQAATDTSNMARALAAQGESTIRIVDTVLASVVESVENDGIDSIITSGRLEAYLRERVQFVPELHGLFVYGADGKWLATSLLKPVKGNNSDRDYFQYHKTNTDREPHVGAPVRSRSTGVWVLPVSRRLENPDGSFAGVALGTIQVDFFARLYDSFDVGRLGTIFLALDNGTLVYRRPYSDSVPGTPITGPVYQMYKETGPVGSAMLKSGVDQVERFYSYRRMDRFPLIVASAHSKKEILGQWQESTILLIVASTLAVGFLTWSGRRMVRQIVIRDKLEQELVVAKESLQSQNSALTVLAKHDGLTGIANRRYFEEFLAFELGRASRNASTLSLILIDVDYFKKFNDRYGHVAGDDCLRKVAAVMAKALQRPTDLAARYGGEEFALVLPDTGRAGAMCVADRIGLALNELATPHADSPHKIVSVSGGLCSVTLALGESVDLKTLVERADALLYSAKLGGRNQFADE